MSSEWPAATLLLHRCVVVRGYMRASSDVCYRWTACLGLSHTHVIRRTNQPLSATNDAETIDEPTRTKLAAAAGHNKTAPAVSHGVVKSRPAALRYCPLLTHLAWGAAQSHGACGARSITPASSTLVSRRPAHSPSAVLAHHRPCHGAN